MHENEQDLFTAPTIGWLSFIFTYAFLKKNQPVKLIYLCYKKQISTLT